AGNIAVDVVDSFILRSGAQLRTDTIGQGNAGDILIEVGGSLDLANDATISSGTFGLGRGGDITVNAGRLVASNGGQISAGSGRQFVSGNFGPSGNIIINTSDLVEVDGIGNLNRSGIFAETSSPNDAGNLNVNTRILRVLNGAAIASGASGSGSLGGDGGTLTIVATDLVEVSGSQANRISALVTEGVLDASADDSATSNAGNLIVETGNLRVLNGGSISSSTFSRGNAGNIFISAENDIVVDGISSDGERFSTVSSAVEAGARGSGGDIAISANNLSLLNGGRLQTTTTGVGDAGDIDVEARNSLNISGFIARGSLQGVPSVILSANGIRRDVVGTGIGGKIQLSAPTITLTNGVVDARTFNSQPGGNITVEADSLGLFQGGQIVSASNGAGPAGTIIIEAAERVEISGFDANFFERLSETSSELIDLLQEESNISVRSFNDGAAGNIVLSTGELTMSDRSQIIAESAAVDGGNITLMMSDFLLLRNNSLISTTAGTAQAGGNGGNITISAPFIVAIPDENSDIAADAFEGAGGNVSITAQGVFGIEPRAQRTSLSDITASSELGISGVVNFNVLDASFIENNLNELSGEFVDTAALTASSCIARSGDTESTFVITGGEGLPQQPESITSTSSSYSTGTVQPVTEPAAIPTIQEPQRVYRLADGRLVLSHECELSESKASA
ncbi:S-layer family protein, partial [Leptolyngbya cf. ectocarpi LEGE 11479]|nr:S-layer family protein [Leptolyngbya cf. ectocarpi LEGE 11479]